MTKPTREQIMQMQPGKVLDALIARHVMKWEIHMTRPNLYVPEGREDAVDLLNSDVQGWVNGWKPSTSIADAWLVVEKLREKHRGVELHISGVKHEDHVFCACVVEGGRDSFESNYIAESAKITAPHAICIAALMVAESEGW